jgi:hypothetical protein
MLSLASVACDPTTLVEQKPDQAVDAEVDMELDLGPSACERACGDVYACAATDDLCPGISAAHEDAVVSDCLTRCEGQRALATEVNRQETCAGKVAFFSGVNTEFDALCRFGPRDVGAVDAGPQDTGLQDAGLEGLDAGLDAGADQ